MTPLEKLIARLVQVIEDAPKIKQGQRITIDVILDTNGEIICWNVIQTTVEGMIKPARNP